MHTDSEGRKPPAAGGLGTATAERSGLRGREGLHRVTYVCGHHWAGLVVGLQ